jgi:hypothetical protein
MKHRKSNLQAVEPDSDKPELQDAMAKRPHKEIRLGREAQHRIGELLRGMYNSYVTEGVPEHFKDLVRRISEDGEQA